MLPGADSLNKRQKSRVLARLRVYYGNREPLKAGITENISEEGLFIKGNVLLPRRSYIRVELITPEHEHVVFIAKVCWIRQASPYYPRVGQMGGMGLRIVRFIEGPAYYLVLYRTLLAQS